jgi:hypothetical protein
MFPHKTNAIVLLSECHHRSLNAVGFLKKVNKRRSVLLSDVENDDGTTRLIVSVIKPPPILERSSIVIEVINRKLVFEASGPSIPSCKHLVNVRTSTYCVGRDPSSSVASRS